MTLDKVLNFWMPVSSFENEDHNLPQRVVVRSERFNTRKGLQTMPFNKHAVRAVLIDRRVGITTGDLASRIRKQVLGWTRG